MVTLLLVHFTDEEIKTREVSDLLKVMELITDGAGI